MERLTGGRLVVAFTALMFANAMSAMDGTIVATAAPTITGELGRLSLLPWISTAYLLAQIAAVPLYGRLGDVHGRTRVFSAAVTLFLVGSICCGLATSMPQLVAFRGLQGAGAGGLTSLSMALVADMAPPARLGRYLGYAGLVFGVTSVLGPVVGGLFVDHLSWRFAFFINVPIGVVGLAIVRALVRSAPRATRSIDYAGAALLAAATTSLLLLTSLGGVDLAWTSPAIAALAATTLLALGAFLVQERRAAEPLFPLGVLRERAVGLAIASNLVAGTGFTAGIVFLPVVFQAVAGQPATRSGALLVPLGLATALTTVAVGQAVHRFGGAKGFPAVGMLLLAAAYALLSTIDAATTPAFAAGAGMLAGVGVGCVMQTLLHVVQRSVPVAHLGVSTSAVMLGRISGGALGVALFGAVFNNRLAHAIARVPGIDVANLQGDPESVSRLAPDVRDAVRSAFASSLGTGFRVLVPLMLVGFATVVAQRGRVLRDRLEPVLGAP